ncbi:MAG: acetoacetyl-CoA synthetase [Ilumatobacteraceae bacterium]|nr:acetoacetyl-CoA synthetase [Ilumatobacteraceae bacterium]
MATNIARFAARNGVDPLDYAALHRWSIDEPDAFWRAIWADGEIIGDPGDVVLQTGAHLAEARFFPDATLNVAENLLARLPADRPALVAYDELGRVGQVSAADLRRDVAACAALFRAAGVTVGDRVAAVLPNGVAVVVAMLAATSLGAVFSSASPDFGVAAVLDRFGQIEPAVLIGCAEYTYAGKHIECGAKLAEIAAGLPTATLRLVVTQGGGTSDVVGFDSWSERVAEHHGAALEFTRLPFDHPWYVLFSSGTTGKPKCIVHRTGGVLLMHAKEQRLNADVSAGDAVFYYTTTGWMMWNWLVSMLATGATVVLYDGSPMHPTQHHVFEIAEAEGLTLLGVSAKFIDSVAQNDLDIAGSHDLSALRTICSTGSPLSPRGFEYVYSRVAADVHLASISGGTDLCGCFVGGVPTLPVHTGEIQARALGMAVEFVDETGRPLGPGDGAGELVCTRPFPSQPLGFWGDEPFGPRGPAYLATYYERFPGMWAHGDFASWIGHDPVDGVVIHGRSDATLNPGGVRIGTADIYGVVDALPEVVESIAFGQQVDHDVRIALVVRLADGAVLDDALVASIKSTIRSRLSPRHVPAVIVAAADLPRTFSGKLVELAVADIVNGRTVRNRGAIANPEALDAIAALPGLKVAAGA